MKQLFVLSLFAFSSSAFAANVALKDLPSFQCTGHNDEGGTLMVLTERMGPTDIRVFHGETRANGAWVVVPSPFKVASATREKTGMEGNRVKYHMTIKGEDQMFTFDLDYTGKIFKGKYKQAVGSFEGVVTNGRVGELNCIEKNLQEKVE